MTPILFLVLAWIFNALWPIIGHNGISLYSPLLFLEAGFAVGFLFLLPWLIWTGSWKKLFSRRLALRFLAIGALYGLCSFVYISALSYTTPSDAGVVAEIEVLYSLILSSWFLREKISSKQALASLLVMTGTALILLHDSSSQRWKGDLMIASAPWMFQVSHILAKKLPPDISPSLIAGARIFYQGAALLPIVLWLAFRHPAWSWSGSGATLLLIQGILVTALAGLFWYGAIRKMDLAKCTAFILSYPALTMLLSWALGEEKISSLQIGGLAATLLGALWLTSLMAAAASPEEAAPALPGPASL